MSEKSYLEQLRLAYEPPIPSFLQDINCLQLSAKKERFEIAKGVHDAFPCLSNRQLFHFEKGDRLPSKHLQVGVVLSGGQAAGGHNVIAGILDGIKQLDPTSQLFGFINGPQGLVDDKYKEITIPLLSSFRNTGGFDLIGSGRTKLETAEQLEAALETVVKHDLDGLVIIGGDDSNTNAALLGEYFESKGSKTKVIGVPKTIDGDLKNEWIEISFGFDTACKVYSELIGNLMKDALSAKKSYFFIKLMGRAASHIALECALQTHPNYTLISEEILKDGKNLKAIVEEMATLIVERSKVKKNYGVFLIPEGVIEFIPDFKEMLEEINYKLGNDPNIDREHLLQALSENAKNCFLQLPKEIAEQLLLDRDPHGNVQVSKIDSERLFAKLVEEELKLRKSQGIYTSTINIQTLFFGYEGRSAFPSNFDASYCYSLGLTAALLVKLGLNGYMAAVQHLTRDPELWEAAAIPLVWMMHEEERKGKRKHVIKKALVDFNRRPFITFTNQRKAWELADDYQFPGPMQFFGPPHLTDVISSTLQLESLPK